MDLGHFCGCFNSKMSEVERSSDSGAVTGFQEGKLCFISQTLPELSQCPGECRH